MIAAPDVPVPYRILTRDEESGDVVTIRIRPLAGAPPRFEPAQFGMVGVAGVGEVPLSISSRIDDDHTHAYTVRRSGAVTASLCAARPGDVVTVRAPLGRPWDLTAATTHHGVFVAGGIGIAPLRAAVEAWLDAAPDGATRTTLLVGANDADDLIYRHWLSDLRHAGVDVQLAVDDAGTGGAVWEGHVGYVTDLIGAGVARAGAHPVAAFVCGPDAMMIAATRALESAGVGRDAIQLTLERNMHCGNGWCGHCQLGPLLLCRDGPVVSAAVLGDLLTRSEL